MCNGFVTINKQLYFYSSEMISEILKFVKLFLFYNNMYFSIFVYFYLRVRTERWDSTVGCSDSWNRCCRACSTYSSSNSDLHIYVNTQINEFLNE